MSVKTADELRQLLKEAEEREYHARQLRMRKCACCGLPFEQKRKTQRFCGRRCQVQAYHQLEKSNKEGMK